MKEQIEEKLQLMQSRSPQSPWIIMYRGKQLTVPSGKSSWKIKAHAKAALNNALYSLNYEFKKEYNESIASYLEREGIVEFRTFEL